MTGLYNHRMASFSEKWSLYRLARKRPYPMTILSGLLLVLSFPPFPFPFLAYIAFVPILLVIDHTPDRMFEDRFWGFFKSIVVTFWRILCYPVHYLAAVLRKKQTPAIRSVVYKRRTISRYAQIFRYCYTSFLIWNMGCCYWMMLTALGDEHPVQAFIAGSVPNIINPFLMAIPIYLFARLRKASRHFWWSLGFIFFWLSFEWFHFHWELSWAWLTLGHSQSFIPYAIQYMEYTGILGVSAVILLVNVLLYQWVRARNLDRRQLRSIGMGLLSVVLLLAVINAVLLHPKRKVYQPVGDLQVRVIQPNIDPYEKFEEGKLTFEDQINHFASLIRKEGLDSIDLAILPETAIPRYIWRRHLSTDRLIQPLWEIVRSDSISLISGLVEMRRFDPSIEAIPPDAIQANFGYYLYYNASTLLRIDTMPQTFQKGKLVPLVERMPWLEHLTFLKDYEVDLGGGFGNYGKPEEMHCLRTHTGTDIASLVCYESEYGDYIRPLILKGAQLITVITNDGWWNFENRSNKRPGSSAHVQHAYLSALRAIETRREVARSANTGTSMYIDNRGRVIKDTPYWEVAWLDHRCKLYDEITFYVRYGDYLGWIALGLSLVFILFFIVKKT